MIVSQIIETTKKPRVNFCHCCGNNLRGKHHVVIYFENVGHDFIFHKDCAKKLDGYCESKKVSFENKPKPGPF